MTNVNPAFRPQKLFNYTPVYSGVDPLDLDKYADSGEMVCIETSAAMIPYLVTAWELFRYEYVIKGNDTEKEHTLQQLQELLSQIMTAEPCQDCPDCPPGGGGGGGGVQLPDCIEVMQSGNDFVINIREDNDCMVTINVYEQGCGCGGGCGGCGGNGGNGLSAGGAGFAAGIGVGSVASWIEETDKASQITTSNIPSNCDFVTGGMVDFIMDQQKELFVQWINSAGAVETFIDGLAALAETFSLGTITGDGVDWLTSFTVESAQNVVDIWFDTDFRLAVKTAFVKTYPDRQRWDSITRLQLLGVAQHIPYVTWAGVLPYGTRDIWKATTLMLNINKLNSHLIRFAGECDQNDMTWLYANAGISYSPPTDPGSLPPPNPFPLAEWVYEFDFTVDAQGWIAGNTPEGSAWGAYDAGIGWGNNSGGATQMHVSCQLVEELDVIAIQTYTDVALPTAIYRYTVRDDLDDEVLHEVEPAPQTNVFTAEIGEVVSKPQVWFYGGNSDPVPIYITKIIMYGSGTPPTTGTDITP